MFYHYRNRKSKPFLQLNNILIKLYLLSFSKSILASCAIAMMYGNGYSPRSAMK